MRHPVFFIILLLASFSVIAQENEPVPDFKMPRTLIKIAPVQFFRNTFELGIESFDKNYKRSANLDLGYRSGSGDWEDARGFHGEIGYRRYAPAMVLKKKGDENFYRGIYYGITVRSEYFSGGTDESALHDYDMKVLSFSPGFILGWQKTLWQAIVLDPYLGGSIRFTEIEYANGSSDQDSFSIFDPRYEGIMPKVGFKLGIGL